MSSLSPTGFSKGQDKQRCYVNSSMQVQIFNIHYRHLSLNIDFDTIIYCLDDSKDKFAPNWQYIVIIQEIQKCLEKYQ